MRNYYADIKKEVYVRSPKRVGLRYSDPTLIEEERKTAEGVCHWVSEHVAGLTDTYYEDPKKTCGLDDKQRACGRNVCKGLYRPERCSSIELTNTCVTIKMRVGGSTMHSAMRAADNACAGIGRQLATIANKFPETDLNTARPCLVEYSDGTYEIIDETDPVFLSSLREM